MKSARALCTFLFLFLAAGLLAQTGTPPEASKSHSSAKAASSTQTVAIARLDGSDGAAKSGDPASTNRGDPGTPKTSPASAAAASGTPGNAPAPAPTPEDQIEQLRSLIETQSKELANTREQMKEQQQKMQHLERQLKSAAGFSSSRETNGESPVSTVPASHSAGTVAALPPSGAAPPPMATAQVSNETSPASEVSPLQLKIGSAYITPVGFMDLTGVWRSRNAGSGIGTNFAGIPYGNGSSFQANQSEFRFSMQNSRIGFRVDANVKGSHVIGYMEADFLGNAPSNLAVSSNSNTLRSRLYWVDWRKGSWEVLGGQTWSLATPNRAGVSPLPGDVFFSYNMDVNYQAGMVWGRIPEFRIDYHFPHDKAAFALAIDSPDQYMGGTNGATSITLPTCCSYYAGGELDNGTSTLGPANRAPDLIAKLVADPSKRLHFEIGGIGRFFQLYNQTSKEHFQTTGGAGFINLDLGITKELRVLTHNYWSDGGGRYIFGSAPDVIVRGNGGPALVHSGSTIDGLEFTHKNTTLWTYYGAIYVPREVAVDTNGCFIGWGYRPSPSTLKGCTGPSSGQNRVVQEGTLGFIHNFWKDGKYGALSLIGQYSYVSRDPWYVAPGAPKNGFSSMAFIDLRYTLPGSAPTMGKPGKE